MIQQVLLTVILTDVDFVLDTDIFDKSEGAQVLAQEVQLVLNYYSHFDQTLPG